MPERSSEYRTPQAAYAALGLVLVGALYLLTWRVLTGAGVGPTWRAAALVAETYLVLATAYYLLVWRPHGRPGVERRRAPRVSAPIPIRYATEEGEVGVGALVDISGRGAGLLVANPRFDAPRVWMQFLWFDDRIGMQGRVVHMRETVDGLRVGLELDRLPAQSAEVLAHYVLPFAASKVWQRDNRNHRPSHLPVQVEGAGVHTWAISEAVGEDGATLLLSQGFPEGTPVTVASWGREPARPATVVEVEGVRRPPHALYRLEVRYVPVRQAHAAADPTPAREASLVSPRA
jgi:hypothetical protein